MGLAYAVPGRWSLVLVPLEALGNSMWTGGLWTFVVFLIYALPFALFGWIDAKWLRMPDTAVLQPIVRAGMLATLCGTVWAPVPATPAILIAPQTIMIQGAEIGGEVLIMWLLLIPSATFAQVVHCRDRKSLRLMVVLCAVILVTAAVLGALRIQHIDALANENETPVVPIMAMKLQLASHAGAHHLTANRSGYDESAFELTRSALSESPSCELAVWPETPLRSDRLRFACGRVSDLAQRLPAPLLMQCPARNDDQGVIARMMGRGVPPGLEHVKSLLVPGYETSLWRGISGDVNGTPGSVMHVSENLRVIPSICYESHSFRHIAEAKKAGGNVIVQMSSFTAFGGPAIDRFDLASSRFLAVEFRTPVVRSVNEGTAGWIDSTGRFVELSAARRQAAKCQPVHLSRSQLTPFALAGPIFEWVPGVFSMLIAFQWRRKPTRDRRRDCQSAREGGALSAPKRG